MHRFPDCQSPRTHSGGCRAYMTSFLQFLQREQQTHAGRNVSTRYNKSILPLTKILVQPALNFRKISSFSQLGSCSETGHMSQGYRAYSSNSRIKQYKLPIEDDFQGNFKRKNCCQLRDSNLGPQRNCLIILTR